MSLEHEKTECRFERAQADIIAIINGHPDPVSGAIGVPRESAVTFATKMDGDDEGLGQTRDGKKGYAIYRNDAWDLIEATMTRIEGGGSAIATTNGRSALNLVLEWAGEANAIWAPNDLYAGSRSLIEKKQGINIRFTDCTRENLLNAVEAYETSHTGQTNTHIIITEPLTNPRLMVSNLPMIADFVREQREKGRRIVTVADNTMTPLLIRPFDYGFDFVIHSMTKYIGGHNDAFGGVVVAAKDQEQAANELREWRNITGAVLSSHDAEKLATSIQDFPLRLRNQCRNAFALAQWLSTRPEIEVLNYPGLADNPHHALAKDIMGDMYGGVVSLRLKGDLCTARKFIRAANTAGLSLADSFGGPTTLLNWPGHQSAFYKYLPEPVRNKLGVSDTFFRVAVGRGSEKAIIDSFERTFAALNHG